MCAVQNRSCERRLTSHALCQKRIHPISPLLSTEQDRKLVPILVSCVFLKYDQNFLAKNACLSISAVLQMFTPRTPREEIAFTARPRIHSHSQIFRYGGSIFCLPHRPNFLDIFDLCLNWVSVVRVWGMPK